MKNSAVPLCMPYNMNEQHASEAVCTLSVTVGYCTTKNSGAVREVKLKKCCYQQSQYLLHNCISLSYRATH